LISANTSRESEKRKKEEYQLVGEPRKHRRNMRHTKSL